MKVYLRHSRTGLFYTGWHNWTRDITQASNFGTVASATRRALDEKLAAVEVVVLEDHQAAELVVPVEFPRDW